LFSFNSGAKAQQGIFFYFLRKEMFPVVVRKKGASRQLCGEDAFSPFLREAFACPKKD
jgi:hypothetical protein